MKKSVKRSLAIGAGVLVVVGGAWGYTTLKGATPDIDPSKLATVERGTMTRSVVATGKIEPITKVEIKSKANGIIERLQRRRRPGRQARRRARRARQGEPARAGARVDANLQAAKARRRSRRGAAEEGQGRRRSRPTSSSRAATTSARSSLPRRSCVSPQSLDDAKSALEMAQNRKRARAGAARHQPGEAVGSQRQRGAGAGRRRPQRRAARQRHDPRADQRHGADARRRDRQPRLVDPEHGLGRHAGDDARRHQPGVRPRQGGRSGHRPRAPRPARAHHASRRSRTRSSRAGSRRSRRSAPRRTTSRPSR